MSVMKDLRRAMEQSEGTDMEMDSFLRNSFHPGEKMGIVKQQIFDLVHHQMVKNGYAGSENDIELANKVGEIMREISQNQKGEDE